MNLHGGKNAKFKLQEQKNLRSMNIHWFKNYTSCGSKFVDSDRGRRVELSTQNVYYVGRKNE